MNPISLIPGAVKAVAGAVNPVDLVDGVAGSFSAVFDSLKSEPDAERAGAPSAISSARLDRQRELATTLTPLGDGAVDLGGLSQQSLAELAKVYDRLASLAAAQGIDLRDGFDISIQDGRLLVSGGREQQAAIESLFEQDPSLFDSLKRLTAQFELLAAADAHREFARAYERDPVGSVNAFGHLFADGSASPLAFHFDDYGAEPTR
jgi:hypothetical protein